MILVAGKIEIKEPIDAEIYWRRAKRPETAERMLETVLERNVITHIGSVTKQNIEAHKKSVVHRNLGWFLEAYDKRMKELDNG